MPISRSTDHNRAVETNTAGIGVRASVLLLIATSWIVAACGVLDRGTEVAGFPDVDLGVPVEVYKVTPQRNLHLHLFGADEAASPARGVVLFFHGGGFASTRVEQFERQAQLLADNGIVGVVVEYRVTAEGISRADAVTDGTDAVEWVIEHAADLGVDPERVAVAGGSAGGALAAEASTSADVAVLFNPAVGAPSAPYVARLPTIVFHSREDTIVPFSSAESFCDAASDCELVAFDEGDHGFFNDEPAFSATNEAMLEFLRANGW